ncbi:alpha/beta hydrolase family protein [Aminivibrio pyruvatiphilus]|uniref:Alpha/beta hydrolase family protein n=1 Tax=Aminivibrio pyruvatiphilus TaxID=1005740 RepID=A0A4R8MBU2_9BACT|nr:alpha/beta fold hydrolase [Aminivibrio pyruvatiphilus]TDY63160.1 alpha/beta hydrolase family protein [Aminivibrio pyruvatiphilus]
MFRNCIFSDPPAADRCFPPSGRALTLRSEGCDLYGVMYHPAGKGPHPTMVIFHGFPGTEKNGDLAQIFRRAGFNTIVFSYRGAWGSQGDFSFSHVIEDSRNVLRFLRSPEARETYAVDGDRIVAAGHSMGGFAAVKAAEECTFVKDILFLSGWNVGLDGKRAAADKSLGQKLRGLLDECAPPLAGTSGDALWEELMDRREDFDLLNSVPAFAGRNLLLVGASRDAITPPDVHHTSLLDALRKDGRASVRGVMMEDDHGYSASRVALAEALLDHLEKRGY